MPLTLKNGQRVILEDDGAPFSDEMVEIGATTGTILSFEPSIEDEFFVQVSLDSGDVAEFSSTVLKNLET